MTRPLDSPRGWLRCRRPAPHAVVSLVAVPPAGRGGGLYHEWGATLPPWVEFWAVTAPGREHRLAEAAPETIDAYVRSLGREVSSLPERPLALFGHSMGATVAYELARGLLRDADGRATSTPLHLFVSGARAPSLPPDRPRAEGLTDPELVEMVRRRYGGFPEAMQEHPDLLELGLEVLRADLAALDRYRYERRPPIPVPITALGGREDPGVSRSDLEAWAEETAGPFDVRLLPGDHGFVESEAEAVLAVVKETLRRPPGSR